ncbi:Fur family transcriptional regulator [Pontibacter silvestris]|uniref:Fur family transcriptional regulator n=1 Tax=Pontibacter silvestris TaxID=2305183 RepID=A0ABW4WYS4_9BACT|nr:transcriptional repressor [Pontibacter silvestris]MCC9135556.1 transcriptional repressor [Pontibacter silvestris]
MQLLNRNELRERIVISGLKATQQRIVVYEALVQQHGHHPTAEEVYQLLKPANPSISLGTVYKTLDSFVETNLIRRVLSEESGKRYDANTMAHSHIYCSNTKEIIDYEDAELEQLLTDFFRKRNMENFEIKSFAVQLTGNKKEPGKQIRISQVPK